jgi:YidC/Oxa1 family membrane protein insertase
MYKSQREMQRIQPQLKALQDKYKDDKVVMNEKVMAFYKEHGVNPFASCFPMLIQLPFLWWVYATIRAYEFHFVNGKFLWIGSSLAHQFPGIVAGNLGQFDVPLLCLYAGSNYLTMKLTPATDPQAAQTQKQTSIMMTVMMFWMFMMYKWSAAFIFYWLVINAISAYRRGRRGDTAGRAGRRARAEPRDGKRPGPIAGRAPVHSDPERGHAAAPPKEGRKVGPFRRSQSEAGLRFPIDRSAAVPG